jgi:chromosome segregation ATPase
MFKLTWGPSLALAAAVVVGAASAVSGQDESSSPGALGRLVAEVQALRADVAQASSVGIRAQLLVGRLQLQEQRISSVGRQLADAQAELQSVERSNADLATRLRVLHDRQERLGGEGVEREVEAASLALDNAAQREPTLRALEQSLASLLDEEQARWTDYSSRLDDIERALPAR